MDIANGATYALDNLLQTSYTGKRGLSNSPTLWNSFAVSTFFYACRFWGILVSCNSPDQNRKNRYLWIIHRLWQKLLIVVALSVAALDTWKSVIRYKDRLTSWEFTAMGIAFHRFTLVTLGIVIATRVAQFSRKTQLLMQEIDALSGEFSTWKMSKILTRWKLGRLAALCCAVWFGSLLAGILSAYFTFRGVAARSAVTEPKCGWSCPADFPFTKTAPIWVILMFYCVAYIFTIGLFICPQMVVYLLIYPLGLWCDELSSNIKVCPTSPHSSKKAPRREMRFFLEVIHCSWNSSKKTLVRHTSKVYGHGQAQRFLPFPSAGLPNVLDSLRHLHFWPTGNLQTYTKVVTPRWLRDLLIFCELPIWLGTKQYFIWLYLCFCATES